MTLLNVINIGVLVILTALAFASYWCMRKQVDDAEGFGSINERGEIGSSDEGDIVGEA